MSSPRTGAGEAVRRGRARSPFGVSDPEAALSAYFASRGGRGAAAVRSAFRHPVSLLAAEVLIARLATVDAVLVEEGDAELVRRGLLRSNRLARGVVRGTTAVLTLPEDADDFLVGSSESKRSLRTRYNRANRRGFHVDRPVGASERSALLALADEYERSHASDLYRNEDPDNDYLLALPNWLVARNGDGRPLLLAVPAVSGRWAVLQHFKTLEDSDDARLARYWMSVELVMALHALGVRHLADVLSPIGLPPGLRDFQRRLGYRLVRVRLRSPR